jgi:hypothetical protein
VQRSQRAMRIGAPIFGSAKSLAKSRQRMFFSIVQNAGADEYTGIFNLFQHKYFLPPARLNDGDAEVPGRAPSFGGLSPTAFSC